MLVDDKALVVIFGIAVLGDLPQAIRLSNEPSKNFKGKREDDGGRQQRNKKVSGSCWHRGYVDWALASCFVYCGLSRRQGRLHTLRLTLPTLHLHTANFKRAMILSVPPKRVPFSFSPLTLPFPSSLVNSSIAMHRTSLSSLVGYLGAFSLVLAHSQQFEVSYDAPLGRTCSEENGSTTVVKYVKTASAI